jgi:hypothetical protein
MKEVPIFESQMYRANHVAIWRANGSSFNVFGCDPDLFVGILAINECPILAARDPAKDHLPIWQGDVIFLVFAFLARKSATTRSLGGLVFGFGINNISAVFPELVIFHLPD